MASLCHVGGLCSSLCARRARYQSYVKRVAALPGDVVELRGDQLYVNGRDLDTASGGATGPDLVETNACASYPVLLGDPAERTAPSDLAPTQVPNGHVFALCDSRRRAIISREFGPVCWPTSSGVDRVANRGFTAVARGNCATERARTR